jgi:hypothetical protein
MRDQKILNEAATVAEQRIKEKFPELAAGVPALGEKAQTQTYRLQEQSASG